MLYLLPEELPADVVEGDLGAATFLRMVENAAGHIEGESQLGQGTTFRVYFRR